MHSRGMRRAQRCARHVDPARPRSAFSLFELLVVTAIVAALVAMLLPALQQAREGGRRAQCLSQLRQIGLGLHAYHGAFQAFPPGCTEPKTRRLAWSAYLLPYLEQSSVWRRLDLSKPYSHAGNHTAGSVVLPIYL